MINRSSIKYSLKKILPKALFSLVLFIWRELLLYVVEAIDSVRVKKFTKYHSVTLTHLGSSFSLFISPSNGFIDKHIFLYGIYEPFIFDLFAKYIRPGMTVIDVGANIGEHTMYAACLVGKDGSVYSFEPIPHLYEQIHDSVKQNHFESIVHTKNYALGKEDMTEKLHVSKNAGGSSIVHDDDTQELITVNVKKGDSELLLLNKVDVVKIDVEGYEYEVLLGMKEVLRRDQPLIFIEFSGGAYSTQGKDHGGKILSFLREYNYSLYDIENDMQEITDDKDFLSLFPRAMTQTNLLCLQKK